MTTYRSGPYLLFLVTLESHLLSIYTFPPSFWLPSKYMYIYINIFLLPFFININMYFFCYLIFVKCAFLTLDNLLVSSISWVSIWQYRANIICMELKMTDYLKLRKTTHQMQLRNPGTYRTKKYIHKDLEPQVSQPCKGYWIWIPNVQCKNKNKNSHKDRNITLANCN